MTPPHTVQTRHVFFIGGFDPKSASHFYRQHAFELARYSQLKGTTHHISPRQKSGQNHCWTVHANTQNRQTQTVFEYLAWDDIVRSQWARSPGELVGQALRCLWDYPRGGAMWRLYRMAPATARAAWFPYLLALLAGTSVAAMGWASASGLQLVLAPNFAVIGGTTLATLASAVLAWRVLMRIPSSWFLRVLAFANALARHDASQPQTLALDQRLDDWAAQLCQVAKQDGVDEILLVGYSAGSSLAMPLLARALGACQRGSAPTADLTKLRLLTLGNCIPVAAALPAGKQVRQDIATVGRSTVPWLDFTAPIDWGSFALTDPVLVFAPQADTANAANTKAQKRQFVSPQFHLLFDAATYPSIKSNKYRVHQLYLQCPGRLGRYDYFGMLYGDIPFDQHMISILPTAVLPRS